MKHCDQNLINEIFKTYVKIEDKKVEKFDFETDGLEFCEPEFEKIDCFYQKIRDNRDCGFIINGPTLAGKSTVWKV